MRRVNPVKAGVMAGVLLLGLALAQGVRAQTPPASQPLTEAEAKQRAKELFALAETEYRFGRFQAALADYQAALKLRHHPSIIFNVAQCYRQLKQHERALFYYKLFLADWERVYPGTRPPNEAEVQGHITTLEAAVKAAEQRAREAGARATGDLVLRDVPGGAQVFVDGVLRGAGPILAPISVPPGRHQVRVERQGYEAVVEEVLIAVGKAASLQVRLRKLVTVAVESTPEGAVLTVDGEERGVTPLRLSLAAERAHRLVLRKAGFRPLEEALTLPPREGTSASYSLEPTPERFGTRNENVSLEGGLAVGMGGRQGLAAGALALNLGTIKWRHVHWTVFTVGGGVGSGRWFTHLESRLAYPFRFGRRGQHQLRAGLGFGVLAVSVDDVTRAQLDLAWVQEKSTQYGGEGDGPFITLVLSPAVEYGYQTRGRTVFGGGFRALIPLTRSFDHGRDGSPAVGLLTLRIGWAYQL